jgi:hypothetical protein
VHGAAEDYAARPKRRGRTTIYVRDTNVDGNVIGHILGVVPGERQPDPTVMPLSSGCLCFPNNAPAVVPCLHHVVVSRALTYQPNLQTITHLITATNPEQAKTQHGLPLPLPPLPGETALDKAIEAASHPQLCQILRQLCSHSKTAADLTTGHLLPCPPKQEAPKQTLPRSILKKTRSVSQQPSPTIKSTFNPPASSLPLPAAQTYSQGTSSSTNVKASPRDKSLSPTGTHTPKHPRSQKRKATSQCRNCGSECSTTTAVNPPSAAGKCVHHPGKREVNPEHTVWDDFDPDVSGDAWTLMEYEAFASGFRWSCCKREVGGKGCVVGRCEAVEVGEWKRGRR